MRNETRFTMMTPAAGFTSRVMARIAEYERAQARRRALIGSALLVIAAGVILILVAGWLSAWIAALITTPSALVSLWSTLATLAFWTRKFIEMVWTAMTVITDQVDASQLLMLGIGVFALTLIWVRVVIGPFRFSSTSVGG